MKLSNEAGFTIIETMLFLAITALLIMGVLIGTGNSINIQRYRDSVSSFQSFLQQQYFDVANVNNDSTSNIACSGSSIDLPRGQSDCVILGKFINTTDSHQLKVQTVIGHIPSGSVASLNDINIFLDYIDVNINGVISRKYGYNIQPSSLATQSYDIEWGSTIIDTVANHSNPMVFSMLILRSPLSGTLRTFISLSNIGSIQNLLKPEFQKEVEMCVDSNGLFTGARSAVIVTADATSASSIETLGGASGC